MEDVGTKILNIVISEIVEALFFIFCLIVVSMLPVDSIRQQISTLIIILWAVAGIGTPIVILLELEDQISPILKTLTGR